MQDIGIGLALWNGESFLDSLIQSLLKQKFTDFTLYILDNQSEDSSVQIISRYSADPRIVYIRDSEKRNFVDAQKILFYRFMMNHTFCAFACDDDIYHEDFIFENINNIKKNDLGLSYSDFSYIDENDQTIKAKSGSPLYTASTPFNSIKFFLYRNCIPVFFGVYRSERLFKHMSDFRRVDNNGFNHENLMLFSFLLDEKIGFLSTKHFCYRVKDRQKIYSWRGYWYVTSTFPALIRSVAHQYKFCVACAEIVNTRHRTLSPVRLVFLMALPMTFCYYTVAVFIRNFIADSLKRIRFQSIFRRH